MYSLIVSGFCEASRKVYAAVVCLILKVSIAVAFAVSKTRVAPLQPLTFPRLGLLSALHLSRLTVSESNSLQSMCPQLELKCYTSYSLAHSSAAVTMTRLPSRIILGYVLTDKEWKPFVRNRVAEMQGNNSPKCWCQCAGKTNPAELPSRDLRLLTTSCGTADQTGYVHVCHHRTHQKQVIFPRSA